MPGLDGLDRPWQAPAGTPWLGDVLLGAVGAVHGELPALRLQPPGGPRTSTGQQNPGVADLSGEEQSALINPSPVQARERTGFESAARAVVVLVDGLGWHNLMARAELAPFLTGEFTVLQGSSALPSTTAANITFLGTASLPGQTAMAGYTVRNPETGRVMNLISWAGGMDPLGWQRVPTIFERLAAAGVDSAHVSTWRFERSALTQAALRGARYVAAETLPERVEATADLMRETDTRITYLYWADVDAVGHLKGWRTRDWEAELQHVDREMARLARMLPPDTLLVLTADHGMVDVPRGRSEVFDGPARIDISAHGELSRGIDMIAGENRFLHLFTADPGAVARRWRDFFAERAVVWTRAEAFAAGLFGPVRADVAEVVGDVMVAFLGDMSAGDTRVMSESMFNLPGLHGSVTAWERTVPVLSLVTR